MKTLIADQQLVTELAPMADAIEVMRRALILLEEGDVVMPLRTMVELPGEPGTVMGLMPSYMGGLEAVGVKVVAVSDSRGGIHVPTGLDPDAVLAHKQATGSVTGYAGAEDITNGQLLELSVDILVPAALENQLAGDNAGRIQAKTVLELANGPTTPEADAKLRERQAVVLPDVLANAGGVTVSYLEWFQNRHGESWDEDRVNGRMKEVMTAATGAVLERAAKYGVPLREAAFILGLERLQAAILERGWD